MKTAISRKKTDLIPKHKLPNLPILMHTKSLLRWTTEAYHCNASLIHLNIVLSSAKLMCFFFTYWMQPICILHQGSTASYDNTYNQGVCVNSHGDFVSIHAPITMGWILLPNSSDDVFQQEWVPCFIIPANCYRICLSIHKYNCNKELTTHWQGSG